MMAPVCFFIRPTGFQPFPFPFLPVVFNAPVPGVAEPLPKAHNTYIFSMLYYTPNCPVCQEENPAKCLFFCICPPARCLNLKSLLCQRSSTVQVIPAVLYQTVSSVSNLFYIRCKTVVRGEILRRITFFFKNRIFFKKALTTGEYGDIIKYHNSYRNCRL